MLCRIDFRHNFAKKQQQESKDYSYNQELQYNRSSKINYPCKEKIAEHNDGFILAEEDLLIRGAGDLFGEKQSGGVTFKMADVVVDSDLLNLANVCADEMINSHKLFDNKEYENLLQCAKINYDTKKEMLE